MNRQAGMTLTELAIATSVVALVMTSATSVALPMLARENLRSATYELQSTLQVSRLEAVARNRPTRFVLDPKTRTLQSWDTMGTDSTGDDVLLRQAALPRSVSLASPETGDAVTLGTNDGGAYEAQFSADGSAAGSTGKVALYGGGMYRRLSLHAAGGTEIDDWSNHRWTKKEYEEAKEQYLASEWEKVREGYVDDIHETETTEELPDPGTDDGKIL